MFQRKPERTAGFSATVHKYGKVGVGGRGGCNYRLLLKHTQIWPFRARTQLLRCPLHDHCTALDGYDLKFIIHS